MDTSTNANRYSLAALLRIAHLEACRDLSDSARSEVTADGDGRHAGELVEHARGLVGQAERILKLAVAAERGASVSWETIGEALEVSRQTAHERFSKTVEGILDDVVFPNREGVGDTPGWWAGPEGLEDPARTVERLDAWVVRHQEASEPGSSSTPVSESLGDRRENAGDGIDVVRRLTRQMAAGALPSGVDERTAQRVLLEHKLATFDQIAGTRDLIAAELELARRELDHAEWEMTRSGYWTAADGTYGRQTADAEPGEPADGHVDVPDDDSTVVDNYLSWHQAVEDLASQLAFTGEKQAAEARQQADRALRELIAWHREDLDERLGVESITTDGLEGYRFSLGDQPVAELRFSVGLEPEETGWFLHSIDPDAMERTPESPWEWLGDPWPVQVAGVDVDELTNRAGDQGLDAMSEAAGVVVDRTRSSALLQARRDLVAELADEHTRVAAGLTNRASIARMLVAEKQPPR